MKSQPNPEWVKQIRAELNISTAELAAKCGVSPRTVEGWEGGKPLPNRARMMMHRVKSRQVIADLIAVGTGEIPHRYMGACPDLADGHERRDKRCPACRVLIRAGKLE